MKSRMEKYYDENEQYIQKRTHKNSELYKEITNNELNDFSLSSNAKIIGENDANYVNVEKLKEILEKNYQSSPRRREIKLAEEKKEKTVEIEKTKEYDINSILEKAREGKQIDYEKERLKKVRDTQYDILKNLDIEEEENGSKAAGNKTKKELANLMQTITENELQKTKIDLDPLDILTDLKGHDNTLIISGQEMKQELDKQDTNGIIFTQSDFEEFKKIKAIDESAKNKKISLNIDEEEKSDEEEKNAKVDNSFYTNSLTFTQSDFDDFNDLKNDMASSKLILKIVIVILVIAFMIGLLFLLNKFLNLGLF